MLLTLPQLEKLFGIYESENWESHKTKKHVGLLGNFNENVLSRVKANIQRMAELIVITANPEFNKYYGNRFQFFSSAEDKAAMDRLGPALEQATLAKANENEKYQDYIRVEETINQVKKLLLSASDQASFNTESQQELIKLLSSMNEFFEKKTEELDFLICHERESGITNQAEYNEVRDFNVEYSTSKKMLELAQLLTKIEAEQSPDKIETLLSQFKESSFNHWYAMTIMQRWDHAQRFQPSRNPFSLYDYPMQRSDDAQDYRSPLNLRF